MEDGPAHVWWLVRRGEVWVVEVSGSNSAVLVMSSLAQLLVLLCRDVLLYISHSEWEGDRFSVYHGCGMDICYYWLTVTKTFILPAHLLYVYTFIHACAQSYMTTHTAHVLILCTFQHNQISNTCMH